jgi:hypothetical protein
MRPCTNASALAAIAVGGLVLPLPGATFDELDLNKDGMLSREEFNRQSRSPVPVAKSTPVPELPKPEKKQRILGDVISIRKSFLAAKDKGLPAKFSWTNSMKDGDFITADLSIGLSEKTGFLHGDDIPTALGRMSYSVRPTVEVHASTKQGAEQDSVAYRVPVYLDFITVPTVAPGQDPIAALTSGGHDPFISDQHFIISPVLETDRAHDAMTLGGDAYYTASIDSLLIGNDFPIPFTDGRGIFAWRPWIGIEGGTVLDDANKPDLISRNGFFRVVGKAQADLWWQGQFQLSASYLYRWDLTNGHDQNGLVDVSAIYHFDDHSSIGVSYKNGRSTPAFEKVESLSAWFGIKY